MHGQRKSVSVETAIFTRCVMFPYTRPYILTLKMYTHAWRISEKKRLPGTNELPVNGKET